MKMKKTVLLLLALGLLSMSVVACAGTGIGGYVTPAAGGPDDNDTDLDGDVPEDGLPEDESLDSASEDDGSDFICDANIVLRGEGGQSNAEMMIPEFISVTGTIESIEEINRLTTHIHIEDADGNPAILVVSGGTAFPFGENFEVGDVVTGWYLTNMPMILPWPPQYSVSVLAVNAPDDVRVRVDRFFAWEDNDEGYFISQDKMFAFRTDENTEILLVNGDVLTEDEIAGFRLIVFYGISTRSIPEMTTADRVIRLYESIVPV